jgi:hypothetical protein
MCYLSKNLQNISHFVTLFLAHGDVVVGFAIFHIVSFQKEKKRKKRKKGTPPWYVNVGGHPWNRLAMVCERKKVGRTAKLYKRHQSVNLSLKNLLYFYMEDSKSPIASH